MKLYPLVTIAIPAFYPRFFEMAIQSAVDQSYENLEIVVCDDSDDDEIEQMVMARVHAGHSGIRYLRNSHRLGFADNLQRCVDNAKGEFIKVLCDDDLLFPHCVSEQALALNSCPESKLVISPRLFSDENNYILPHRLQNIALPLGDSLLKGQDILAFLDGQAVNFLGNFSSALMRTSDLRELLPALTEPGKGFLAILDLVMFVCLLRRADLIMLHTTGSVERLHPSRLSRQVDTLLQAKNEWSWLMQMLSSRTGEDAPADGWVRFVDLVDAQVSPRQWKELPIQRILGTWQTRLSSRVGSDCESYDELYQQWLSCRKLSDAQRRLLPQTIAAWPARPRIILVVLDPESNDSDVRSTLASLSAQLYAPSTVVVFSNTFVERNGHLITGTLQKNWPSQVNELPVQLAGDWIYLLRAGDVLNESALLVLAERITAIPNLACVYSDEGELKEGRSFEPVFKPDFNLDLLRSYPYVGRSLAFSCQALLEHGGFNADFGELAPHDLLWRIVETAGLAAIEHIAEVQVESRFTFAQWVSSSEVTEQNSRVLFAHLQRLGVAHKLNKEGQPWLNRVDYLLDLQPMVSIIVSSGDDLEALQVCVERLIEHTAYARYEILIVSGQKSTIEMNSWLDAMSHLAPSMLRVLHSPGPDTYAGRVNFAAGQAQGDFILLLSPTLRVFSGDWLNELLNHAVRPEVGIVGPKVVSVEGKTVGMGAVLALESCAKAAFEGIDAHSPGYMQRLQVVQNWSVVSGACMMVRKEVFQNVGGLEEHSFGAVLAGVDFCLKVGSQGYLVVSTPYATMLGSPASYLTITGNSVKDLEERDALYRRWLPTFVKDPAYSPVLSPVKANFALDPGMISGWTPFRSRSLPFVLGLPVNASAVGHYRVVQPFLQLESAGHITGRCSYETPGVMSFERMKPDIVIFQLRHTASAVDDMARLKRFSDVRSIFEIDDYILDVPKKNIHARDKPADVREQLQRGIAQCERVIVTTNALANALNDMHHDIRVVPNMLAQHLWSGVRSMRGASSKPRVGWGGGTSHTGDLEIIADVVRELADEVEWVFFGMCPDALRPYIHEFHPCVRLDVYPQKLASLNLDLALAPLEFHLFNDCKSNLRLLEYGACGYPVICTDTEAYRGYLPCTRVRTNSTQEWIEAIRMHLNDPQGSYRMGDELRTVVMRDFVLSQNNLQPWVNAWLVN
ncbi:glycosyltransferase [Pseudomonas mohnii]